MRKTAQIVLRPQVSASRIAALFSPSIAALVANAPLARDEGEPTPEPASPWSHRSIRM